MSRPNNIRKKALDFARNGQWDKALVEFKRLVEVERHNPNLFNEIGDLHLKLADKREAFKSYHEAVDAYSKVGLNNNAVAVCKKILRFNPNDYVVCGKLARLRHQQGFRREAVAYSMTFLEKLLDSADVPAEHLRHLVTEIATAAGDESEVLERAGDYLLKCQFNEDAVTILDRLYRLYSSRGDTEKSDRIREKMASIGHTPAPAFDEGASQSVDRLETVESHRDHSVGGLRESEARQDGIRRGREEDVARDFGVIDIGMPVENPRDVSEQVGECGDAGGRETLPQTVEVADFDPEPTALDSQWGRAQTPMQTADEHGRPADEESSEPVKEYIIPDPDPKEDRGGVLARDEEDVVHTADIVGQYASEVKADVDDDDHRSHYDLGMAYLEMGLLNEAVREFQFASGSSLYQVRSLEMIGRCFIEKNQPELAIKQLTRGLSFVGEDNDDALGIKYSLGLAYEMIGDIARAKSYFEDVYVVDVTFRDVEEKINKYTS